MNFRRDGPLVLGTSSYSIGSAVCRPQWSCSVRNVESGVYC